MRKNGDLIDVIGAIGTDPGSEWGSGDTTTLDHTLRRLNTVSEGTPGGFADPNDITDQWQGFDSDDFEGLGAHPALGGSSSGEVIDLEIFQIQGTGDGSPFEGEMVRTQENVVTGILSNGFTMQTPDDRADGDAATSDGMFVFTAGSPAVEVGDSVTVTGEVIEFFDLTEFSNSPVITVISSGNPLPPFVTLDENDPSGDPESDMNLERFEGMRVQVSRYHYGAYRLLWGHTRGGRDEPDISGARNPISGRDGIARLGR